MKKITLTCAAVVLTTAAAIAQLAPGRMEIDEFRKLHGARKLLVVDVRDSDSFASGHIPGAINVPLGDEEQKAHFDTLKAEKRPIVTYCA
jgi:rhodanese-related sulfurtransferase